jgi:hypothetical protein
VGVERCIVNLMVIVAALAERERIAEYRAADERAIAEYERRQE